MSLIRAVITSRGGTVRFDLPHTQSNKARGPGAAPTLLSAAVIPEAEMKRLDRENILAALNLTNWQVHGQGGAAELLGIPPTTLASRIKRMGLRRPTV